MNTGKEKKPELQTGVAIPVIFMFDLFGRVFRHESRIENLCLLVGTCFCRLAVEFRVLDSLNKTLT